MKSSWFKSIGLSTFFAVAGMVARAQFNIVPLAVSPIYQKAQLWNLTVTNVNPTDVEGRIQLEMTDLATRQAVLSATTSIFRIPHGSMMLQMQAAEPIQYSYNSSAVADRLGSGLLPVGQYQVCYQLVVSYGENRTMTAENCDEIAVEPLSPVVLTAPENDSIVPVMTPNFTWTPPAPTNMFSNLLYDVQISEVLDGQSTTDALEKNLPVQQAQGLQQPFLTFPGGGPQLENGKTYAWQVVARDSRQYAGKSEVWCFKTPTIKDSSLPSRNTSYLLMDGHVNSIGTTDSSALHIKYISTAPQYQASVQIRDQSGNVLVTVPFVIRQGDNYLDIPLNNRLQRKKFYAVYVPDITGRTLFLPFTVK